MEQSNQQYQGQPYFGQQPGAPNVVKPSSNLVWAILSTLFCCMPFGIVAIVYAAKVDSLWSTGKNQEAYDASESAKKWAMASLIAGLIIFVIYFCIGFASAF